ncbi:hypothetical protein JNB_14788 [Janibacter sp. HTCC2649]|uniref:hypothetical protein n=1 Tax=Janibacter sp. HTCC2649 TaxID=313589 RepID=UPI000067199F|nr:hypothetical protein [Janibacter sp. HTCC2649]EAP98240.1 hypothetical protein JNB_14788 [Janibacter sp. HTCC2649]
MKTIRTTLYAGAREIGPTRLLLGAAGLVFLAVGVWQFLAHVPTSGWLRVGLWIGAGIAVHDGVLAPLGVVTGWLVARRAPERARPVVRVLGLAVLTLVIIAVPLLATGGLRT